MKNVNKCTKCGSIEVLRVKGQSQGYGPGNNLQLSLFSQVLVSKYVCCTCGFIEDWIDNPQNMEKVRNYYLKHEKQQPVNKRSPTVR